MSKNRIQVREHTGRRGFSIVFDQLWTDYLPHVGGHGVLLYCFLKYKSGSEIPDPCSAEWEQEVCHGLGLTLAESHEAWARLQEMGLIIHEEGSYIVCDAVGVSVQAVSSEPVGDSLYSQVEALFGRVLGSSEIARLEELAGEYSQELIILAVEAAAHEQALSFPYIVRVLADWKRRKLTTPDAINVYLEERRQAKLSKEIIKGRRNSRIPQVNPGDLMNYGDHELILKRLKQAARGED